MASLLAGVGQLSQLAKLWPQVTHAENFVTFGRVVFEICERADGQTDRQTNVQRRRSQCFAPLSGGELTKAGCSV